LILFLKNLLIPILNLLFCLSFCENEFKHLFPQLSKDAHSKQKIINEFF